jgi:hypothetical protein
MSAPDGCACVLRAQVWDFGRPTMQVAVAGLCAFSFLWGVAASLEPQREPSFFGVLVSLSVAGAQLASRIDEDGFSSAMQLRHRFRGSEFAQAHSD